MKFQSNVTLAESQFRFPMPYSLRRRDALMNNLRKSLRHSAGNVESKGFLVCFFKVRKRHQICALGSSLKGSSKQDGLKHKRQDNNEGR